MESLKCKESPPLPPSDSRDARQGCSVLVAQPVQLSSALRTSPAATTDFLSSVWCRARASKQTWMYLYIYGSQLPVPHISGIMRSVYTDWLTETHPHYFANENWSGLVKVGRKDALLSHCLPLLSMTVSRALRNSVKTDDNTTHCIVVSCFSLVLPHPGPPPLAENTIRLVQL